MIRTKYNHPGTRTTLKCLLPSMAFESEKAGTTIDSYLAKYKATGFFGDPQRKAAAMSGDFSGLEDFQTIMTKMNRIREHFEALPSNTRRFFNDEPANYVAFVTNPANFQKSVQMGLLVPENVNEKTQQQPTQVVPQPSAQVKDEAKAS